MNHLGDTNKMVSDTPRTDKVTRIYGDASVEWEEELVPVDACRAIERELNAANQRIKRLEEALEGTVKWIVHLADSGDAGFWDVEKQSEIIAARAALKKESKP